MEDTEGDREFRQDDDHQQNHGQDGDDEGYEPAPKKGDHFDGSKTQTSIRSGGSKQGSQIAYSEMTEKVAVKSTRKKIEQDIQLLKNRVRMLQKEKEKADKKIVETKSKAEEIMKRKVENDELYEMKCREKEHKQKIVAEKQHKK